MASLLTNFTTRHPWLTMGSTAAVALVLAVFATLPSIWPSTFTALNPVTIDTDPENMLDENEAVRVFHHRMKEALNLHDMVVLGVVNEEHPDGVFNPESLARVHELTEFASTLRGTAIGVDDPNAGVVEVEMIAPSTVDNIEQAGPGTVRFEWLMGAPPKTRDEALAVREKARRIPFLEGTLVSEDGKALALYLPLTSKDLSYNVYSKLRERIQGFDGDERYFITGLPVAEDTFGVEMFIQMAVSAPLVMLVIFLLMLWFFRKLVLVISPMIVAMASVIITMALLIVTGQTIHIMSSMIPIFIMPIAVLDSIHILSEFFDRYPEIKDRRKTIHEVIGTLYRPMLFTSLTSAAGFASLALTPIPPVQVFGLFVAFGILAAWFLTVTLIPAYVMFIPERSLENFGHVETGRATGLSRVLAWAGGMTYRRSRWILVASLVAVAVAGYGISRIEINDNPTRWFKESHPIREADRVLNEHFGGTYMAYLALTPPGGLVEEEEPVEPEVTAVAEETPEPSLPAGLGGLEVESDPAAWKPTPQRDEPFKRPELLRYVEDLQRHLATVEVVGKSNSLADIVKTVHRELIDGSEEQFRIPDTPAAVAQTLLQYQSSHRPDDLWHFVTPDYDATSVWIQLKSGDNRDMERVVAAMNTFFEQSPPPGGLEPHWFGLTYINVVWQEKMVWGMLKAFLGGFVVVLVMMTLLLRSPVWGLLSMIPLTLTIGFIYGVTGLIGKEYDMPVAVLSALTLGLAVDFAIHFLVRAREIQAEQGSWAATTRIVFAEPARAISRNVIVIALGFTPLLAAPLVPYNTVGVFLAAILGFSGLATLLILPALIRELEKFLFRSAPRRHAMRRRTALFLTLVLAGAGLAAGKAAAAEQPDVDRIVRETNRVAYYQGDDGRARVTMTIRDAKGRERVKEFTILRRDEPGDDRDQQFYVYFHAPSDERGTTFMVRKHLDRDDDRWLYLPALDVQKRIAATDKRTSFAGSHFYYEDVSGRRLTDDGHELVEETDTYYVLKNTPKDPSLVEFDSFTMWIHKASFIPVEVKYEKGGEIYRVAKVLGVKEIQGHLTVVKSQMTDLRTGGSTTVEYDDVSYDIGLTDDLFTERYLRTPPAQYVR